MSELRAYDGYVRVAEAAPMGMITLRSRGAGLEGALAAVGLPVPAQRRIETAGARSIGWMSPDEYLIILPVQDLAPVIGTLRAALAGQHHLVADVSDARTLFHLSGGAVREVLAKACPVDLAPGVFQPREIRRTRAAQVAVALWFEGGDARLICFRSVSDYVFTLFSTLARPGGEVGLFD